MRNLVLPIALVFASVSSLGCGGSFDTVCAKDVCLIVLKNIEEAYPVYASTFKIEFDAAISKKDSLGAITTGGKFDKGIKQLYEDLDNINSDVRSNIIGAYSKYVTAMSGAQSEAARTKASEAFDKVQMEILKLVGDVRKINKKISDVKVKNSTAEWESLFDGGKELRKNAESLKKLNQQ